MDNLTHTLLGVLVGESAAHAVARQAGLAASQRRNLLVVVLALGSNLPDFDLLVAGGKLDYLLHHRGHTHTFAAALLAAALAYGLCELWMRLRQWQPSPRDRAYLAAAALAGPVLHILLDMTNNYGVHPWWPFDNRWRYGDAVFIIEPLLWLAAIPLAFTLRSRLGRAAIVAVIAMGIGLVFLSGMVPRAHAIGFTVLCAAVLLWARSVAPGGRLAIGLGLWLAITSVLLTTSQLVGRRVDALARGTFPNTQLLDRVLTPMPVNPVCWEFILVQEAAGALTLRYGMYSLAPRWIAASRCPGRALDGGMTAPLVSIAQPDEPRVQWRGEVSTALAELQSRWAGDCRVDAFMRFARAPWLHRTAEGWIIGDLRYDREAGLGFAELALDAPARCPSLLPPWIPPRASLAPGR